MSDRTPTSQRNCLNPRYTRVEAVSRPAHPELADVCINEDSDDLSRSEVILKGALAVGAVYGAALVGPYVGRWRRPAAATWASSTSP